MRYSTHTLHPWHGVNIGDKAPNECVGFIEIVPSDTVKYEIDKDSGLLKIDRPQLFSNQLPTLYGFIPQTYCGAEIADFCMQKTGKENIIGDGDPLDICVFTEKNITKNGILVNIIPIGGFRMIDNNEADDKIICVMKEDLVYKDWKDITDIPATMIDRLKHYFLTYKKSPNEDLKRVEITHLYSREEAIEIIKRSMTDYQNLIHETA